MLETRRRRVVGYHEKPTLDYDVSMGIYVYESRALDLSCPTGLPVPELVQRLLDAGEHVAVYRSDDDWFDIGTIGEYERAVAEVERRGGGRREARPRAASTLPSSGTTRSATGSDARAVTLTQIEEAS